MFNRSFTNSFAHRFFFFFNFDSSKSTSHFQKYNTGPCLLPASGILNLFLEFLVCPLKYQHPITTQSSLPAAFKIQLHSPPLAYLLCHPTQSDLVFPALCSHSNLYTFLSEHLTTDYII